MVTISLLSITLANKSFHGKAPNYISDMFTLRINNNNYYNLRGNLKLVLPNSKSTYLQHSFSYCTLPPSYGIEKSS